MRKILFCVFVILIVIVIYILNVDEKIYYLALGNSNKYFGVKKNYSFYVEDYLKEKNVLEKAVFDYTGNDRITSLINKINENEKGNSSTLKNALVKADFVSIKIDVPDLVEKLNDEYVVINDVYDYIDDLSNDLETLFKLIRTYCKENVVFIGYSTCYHKEIFRYLNKRFKGVCDKYNIVFIDVAKFDSNEDCFSAISSKVIGELVLEKLRVDF